ncbi:MAG: hypothetical protein WBV21_16265, partial [Desulfobacterales bacterium]
LYPASSVDPEIAVPPPKGSPLDAADCNRSEQRRNQIRLAGAPVHLVGEFPPLVNLSFGARYVGAGPAVSF